MTKFNNIRGSLAISYNKYNVRVPTVVNYSGARVLSITDYDANDDMYNYKKYLLTSLFTVFASCSLMLQAACVDAVVLVHGNTATPASWDNTYNYLLTKGYSSSDIYRPDWGSKSCAACRRKKARASSTLLRRQRRCRRPRTIFFC